MGVACGLYSSRRTKLCPQISGSGKISMFSQCFFLEEIEGECFVFLPSYIPLVPLRFGSTQFFLYFQRIWILVMEGKVVGS